MSILTTGLKSLRKIQMGAETVPGTAVAADFVFRAPAPGIEDQRELTFAEEDVGYLSGLDRTYVAKLGAAVSMDSHEATYEQTPHILEAGIMTATGTQDGAGTDYIYTYNGPTTAQKTIKTYTIELGDNVQMEEVEHAFVSDFTISGEAGAALMASANWIGRQVTKASFTAALTAPTVETILTSKGKLYIDAEGGTVGTTQISDTILSFELAVTTGWLPVWSVDGNLYFTGVKSTQPEILLTVTFEHNSSGVAQKDAWIAETAKLIQLKFEGAAPGTPGTTYSYKTAIVNLAGKWESFDVIGEQDGNDVLTGTFRARYNTTASLFADFIWVNELSALP